MIKYNQIEQHIFDKLRHFLYIYRCCFIDAYKINPTNILIVAPLITKKLKKMFNLIGVNYIMGTPIFDKRGGVKNCLALMRDPRIVRDRNLKFSNNPVLILGPSNLDKHIIGLRKSTLSGFLITGVFIEPVYMLKMRAIITPHLFFLHIKLNRHFDFNDEGMTSLAFFSNFLFFFILNYLFKFCIKNLKPISNKNIK
jgi:hypothetical protein